MMNAQNKISALFGAGVIAVNGNDFDEEDEKMLSKIMDVKIKDFSNAYKILVDEMLKDAPEEFLEMTVNEVIDMVTSFYG